MDSSGRSSAAADPDEEGSAHSGLLAENSRSTLSP